MAADRVCVTGGLGFIGRHLCRALAERGNEVLCVDRAAPARAVDPSVPLDHQRIRVVRADVSRDALRPLLEDATAVVHLAALPGVRAQHPRGELRRHNTTAAARIAQALGPGQRLVLASTSSVYGNARQLPTPEASPAAPLNPYAVTKLAAERAILHAADRGVDAVICRLFTVFGPGQRPDMAFARWIDAIAHGRQVSWCARPDARREFTYVADAVRGLMAALDHGRAGEVYNVAGSGCSAVRTALGEIESALGRRARIVPRPTFAEAAITSACGRKARDQLGYVPHVGLRAGIARQVEAALAAASIRAAAA